jgi:hypothetical protein
VKLFAGSSAELVQNNMKLAKRNGNSYNWLWPRGYDRPAHRGGGPA